VGSTCKSGGTAGTVTARLPSFGGAKHDSAGVPQKTARQISGHKTDAVFDRYNIVSEADIQDAARKMEARAKPVIHSSFIVAQEQGSESGEKNERKPV